MAHRSRLAGFIIDCDTDDLDAAAAFWSAALGVTIADANAGDGAAQYQKFGQTPGDLHIEVQKVVHPSRVHLDIESDDIDAEAERQAAGRLLQQPACAAMEGRVASRSRQVIDSRERGRTCAGLAT